MNDEERLLLLQRLFDNELSDDDRQFLAQARVDDPESRRYLDQLSRLRVLANRHEPTVSRARPIRFAVEPKARSAHRVLLSFGAIAAGLVAWLAFLNSQPLERGRADGPLSVVRAPVGRVETRSTRTPEQAQGPLEVELYRWANTPARGASGTARAVLSGSSTSHRRSAAREILALELANATPRAMGKVPRVVLSNGALIPGPFRRPTPGHRRPPPNTPSA
ncbi:MAG: hypothetical protein NVSMB9_16830 [Isosphaeraceae bacterium]